MVYDQDGVKVIAFDVDHQTLETRLAQGFECYAVVDGRPQGVFKAESSALVCRRMDHERPEASLNESKPCEGGGLQTRIRGHGRLQGWIPDFMITVWADSYARIAEENRPTNPALASDAFPERAVVEAGEGAAQLVEPRISPEVEE